MITDARTSRRAGLPRRAREMSPLLSTVSASLVLALSAMLGASMSAGASILVAPARFEVEVGASDTSQVLTIVNRGQESLAGIVYAGGAVQRPDGSLEYLDDEVSLRLAGSYVAVGVKELFILPGSHAVIPVIFRSLGDRASFYPVIFVELRPAGNGALPDDGAPEGGGPVQTVARIAVPVLMTNTLKRQGMSFRPVIADLAVKPIPGESGLVVTVSVENAGNVHGETSGEVAIFDPAGGLIASLPVSTGRVLPGATRAVSVRWPAPQSQGVVRVLASLNPVGSEGAAHEAVSRSVDVAWDLSGVPPRVFVTESPGFAALVGDPAWLTSLVFDFPEGE